MDRSLFKTAQQLFEEAIDLPLEQRSAFVRSQSDNDDALYQITCELLESYESLPPVNDTEVEYGIMHVLAESADTVETVLPDESLNDLNRKLAGFELTRKIGQGGMGSVYHARRESGDFEQIVAIKVLRDGLQNELAIDRFRQERQILARLDHSNITRLIDGDALDDGRPYLVMEYTPGTPITDYCHANKLSIRQRLQLLLQLTDALSHAHQNLVIHRDIKPGNVLIDYEGKVRLLDFGIAKLQDEDKLETRTGMMVLTPDYASPEQISGKAVGVASDVYAVGVLMYELLCGQRPHNWRDHSPAEFESLLYNHQPKSPADVVSEHTDQAFSKSLPMSSLGWARALEGELSNITLKALNSDLGQRYRSAAALGDDLRRYLHGEPVLAHPPTLRYRAFKFVGRHKFAVASVSTIFALLVAFGSYSTIQSKHLAEQAIELAQQRDQALREQQRSETISDFLVEAFRQADPTRTLGQDVTAGALLKETVNRLQRNAYTDPELHTKLMITIADAYDGLGADDAAIQLVESLAIDQVTALSQTQILDKRAALYAEKGEEGRALQQIENAIAIATKNADEFSQDSINRLLFRKSVIIDDMGQSDEARLILEKVLAQTNEHEQPEFYLDVCRTTGQVYYGIGEEALAVSVLSSCIDKVNAVETDTSFDWAISQSQINLANYYRRIKQYDRAKRLMQDALDLRLEIFGPEHITPAFTMINMGAIHHVSEEYQSALNLYLKALSIMTRYYEDGSHKLSSTLHNIAFAYYRLDQPEQALLYASQAVLNYERHGRTAHFNITEYQNLRSRILIELGDFDGAERDINSVIDTLIVLNYPKGRSLAKARSILANIMYRTNRREDALSQLQMALPVIREHYSETDKSRIYAEELLNLIQGN